jgi:cyclopropane fatty-acyl-phospholipid synthase-like methyltransferase
LSEAVRDFYEATLTDQRAWSRELNLHFGYYRSGLNPLDREQLLDETNAQVTRRLGLSALSSGLVLDAGTGAGATARHVARAFVKAEVLGLTLSPSQSRAGNAAARREGLHPRVRIEVGDYLATGLPTQGVAAAYAIESSCYAPGRDKHALFQELARVVRPGGRVVVSDAFLRHDRELPPVPRRLHDAMCAHWLLPSLAVVDLAASAMQRVGFHRIRIEDVSMRMIPSVAQAPFLALGFLARERGTLRCSNRRGNLLAPMAAGLAGLFLSHFGYFFLSGERL